jgi:hypothetical protein
LISTKMDEAKPLLDRMKDLKIGELYNNFKAKPTFQNAHLLQSELGTLIRSLEKNPSISTADRAEIKEISSIREKLKSDINSFLEKRDLSSNENLAPAYKRGSDLYFEHVAPYLADAKIRKIVQEGKINVKNIHSSFNTPSNVIDRVTGEEKIGPINKILMDLPAESKNHILFNAIGGKQKNANALLNSLRKAENKGYSEYFSPELKEEMNALNQKIENNKKLMKGLKWTGGASLAGLAAGGANNALSRL